MSGLDKDASILMSNRDKVQTDSPTIAASKSNRTVGGQGLRKFNLSSFNSNIKAKTKEVPPAEVVDTPSEKIAAIEVAAIKVQPKKEPLVEITKEPVQVAVTAVPELTASIVTKEPPAPILEQINIIETSSTDVELTPVINHPVNHTNYSAKIHTKSSPDHTNKEIGSSNIIRKNVADYANVSTNISHNAKSTPAVLKQQENDRVYELSSIRGSRLNFVKFIYELIIKSGGEETPQLTKTFISGATGEAPRTIDKMIEVFIERGFLEVVRAKSGPNGYRVFKLSKPLFNRISLLNNNRPNYANDYANLAPSSIVSYNNINTNNYTQDQRSHNSETKPKNFEFKNLDFTPTRSITWPQINRAIRQQVEECLEQEEVQMFIERFPTWIATLKGVKSPLALFCSELKNFAVDGDSAVNACRSAREILEEQAFLEETKKLAVQEELTQKYIESQQSAELENAYVNWSSKLSDEEKMSIVKPSAICAFGTGFYYQALKVYFQENVFQT